MVTFNTLISFNSITLMLCFFFLCVVSYFYVSTIPGLKDVKFFNTHYFLFLFAFVIGIFFIVFIKFHRIIVELVALLLLLGFLIFFVLLSSMFKGSSDILSTFKSLGYATLSLFVICVMSYLSFLLFE